MRPQTPRNDCARALAGRMALLRAHEKQPAPLSCNLHQRAASSSRARQLARVPMLARIRIMRAAWLHDARQGCRRRRARRRALIPRIVSSLACIFLAPSCPARWPMTSPQQRCRSCVAASSISSAIRR